MSNNSASYVYSQILQTSEKSYYRWKKKDHSILISLLERYFTKEELEEFLESGKIQKLEKSKNYEDFYTLLANTYIDFLIHLEKKSCIKSYFYILDYIQKNKIQATEENFDSVLFYLEKKSKISSEDIANFMRNIKIGTDIYSYIDLNIDSNWDIFNSSVKKLNINQYYKKGHLLLEWIINYQKLLQITIEKDLYNIVFNNVGVRLIPNIPEYKLFKIGTKINQLPKMEETYFIYNRLVCNLIEKIKDDTYLENKRYINCTSEPFSITNSRFNEYISELDL